MTVQVGCGFIAHLKKAFLYWRVKPRSTDKKYWENKLIIKQIYEYCKIFCINCILIGEKMGWIYLIAASIAEIFFALSLKYNEGFTKLIPSIVTAVTGAGSFGLLILAIKTLPLGTAYAIWTGVGAAGIAIAGIFLFKESVDIYRLASIALIIIGVVGLKLFSEE